MTIPEMVKAAREGMHKAIENTKRELSGIRSGKSSPQLLDVVRVEAYGATVPLVQVAMVAAPEPRLLTVQPFDKGLAGAIEKAIRDAGLGLNPQSQGNVIRVPLPMLSEERRKELVKICGKLAEEGRVAVRQARTDAMAPHQEDRKGVRRRKDTRPRRTCRSTPTRRSIRSTRN